MVVMVVVVVRPFPMSNFPTLLLLGKTMSLQPEECGSGSLIYQLCRCHFYHMLGLAATYTGYAGAIFITCCVHESLAAILCPKAGKLRTLTHRCGKSLFFVWFADGFYAFQASNFLWMMYKLAGESDLVVVVVELSII